MNLNKRIDRLEKRTDPVQPVLNIEVISCREQVDYPERFNKVLDEDQTTESGLTRKVYRFKRKEQ